MLLHHSAEKTVEWFGGWQFETFIAAIIGFFVFLFFAGIYDFEALLGGLAALAALSPVWLPVALGVAFWVTWIDYIRLRYWLGYEKVLLEVQLPAEVTKSPLAMEVVFNGIYNNGSETTFIDRFWKGRFVPTWSFEIASNEGRISFYIHAPRLWKDFTEARIYGQYPEAKITEVEDYAHKASDFNLYEYDAWVGEYKKTTKETQALPIKTYVDYELDKDPDTPETKVDPLTHILEIMNGLGKDQYLWLQFIVKARKRDQWYGIYRKTDEYKDSAQAYIKKVMAGAAKRAQAVLKEADVVEGKMNALLTDDEKEAIKAVERSLGKPLFEVGIRAVYFARKERFVGITGAPLFRFFESYRSQFTELKGTRGMVAFDYPWEDFAGLRKAHVKKQQIQFFRDRAYFYVPYDQVPVFLTTEEMASLWHFPGSAVRTPGLDRVPSRVSEAPSNLPTLPT